MKKLILLLAILLGAMASQSQQKITAMPIIQQTGMYYSSDNITSEGLGLGLGVHLLHKSQIAGQADVNILWGNGNAMTTRFAIGYQKKGTWVPAIYGTCTVIWGQRTQLLTETGQKPPVPAWSPGIRISPLMFKTTAGYFSIMELGLGFGAKRGRNVEISILSAGINL